MSETRISCPECGHRTRSPGWVCEACESDQIVKALSAVLAAINRRISRALGTCPYDGCLIKPGEDCPACRLRVAKRHAQVRTGSVRPPAGWVRKGLIYVKKEVA